MSTMRLRWGFLCAEVLPIAFGLRDGAIAPRSFLFLPQDEGVGDALDSDLRDQVSWVALFELSAGMNGLDHHLVPFSNCFAVLAVSVCI